ncbi:hypothetical protein LCGC14_1901480 [marine sediment metagenome]|uniref:Uncharacterized protein n=1 Tax=marine sediment metagenome TaxID=412755 RepID=A0A0F9FWJ8_9ZZZZ
MKAKKQNDLKINYRELKRIITQRYAPRDEGNWVILFFFVLSISLIVYGGINKNIYSLVSGTILLIFFYFTLK